MQHLHLQTESLHIIMLTDQKGKAIEGILALHTPRPTTHTTVCGNICDANADV